VIVNQFFKQSEPGPSHRKTSYEQVDMDTNVRRTIKPKEDSLKWHNVTDTDLALIDDESNPCVVDESAQESSQQLKKARISIGNISRYEDAIDDFVNLTISSSPLHTTETFDFPTAAAQSKRLSCALLPDRDYSQMLDGLIGKLKKKNEPKPRLAIDEYLEKLQIAPVKIERRPDLEPAAIMDRINAKKEEIRKRREKKMEEEQERNSMLPEIPDVGFLMRNFLQR
jgi:hypothetical protein